MTRTARLRAAGAFLSLAALFSATQAIATPHVTFNPTGTGPAYPASSNGAETEVPSIQAHALGDAEIKLDGVLDEGVWGFAQTGWGFRQNDPNRFSEASVQTTFKVLYDEDAIYFGVACFEDDMNNVSSYLSRRDQIEASDVTSIYIDPYHDGTTGYNFRINPAGVQEDHYLFDNGNRDRDWNAVWAAEVSQDENGWYVEVRIPFSAVRFKGGDEMTWGVQVYRWMHGRGEDTGWVVWDRNLSGFVNRWGTLEGLHDVASPRTLELLPYFVTRHEDPAVEGDADEWENTQNFGLDLKYGPSPTLTLNATIQPDFGQVEADPAVLNLSPFEVYYQEKRPFFIEGARFFQHPDFNLFYSRRIGTGDQNSRIRGAAKLTGKIGKDYRIAALAAATDLTETGQRHNLFKMGNERTYYGLLRLGREFQDNRHNVNLMGTVVKRVQDSFEDSAVDLQRDAVSGGADFQMTFDDRMYEVEGSVVGTVISPFADRFDSTASTASRYGTGGHLEVQKTSGVWRGELTGRWESDDLDPNDMGFLSAGDEVLARYEVSYNYDSDGRDGLFENYRFRLDGYKSWLYAAGAGQDLNTGQEIWSYGRGHRQFTGNHFFTSGRLKSYHEGWFYLGNSLEGSDRYVTRDYEGLRGPLMTQPKRYLLITGITTDWRKSFSVEPEFIMNWGQLMSGPGGSVNVRWNQDEHFSHQLRLGYEQIKFGAQWIYNTANDASLPGVVGIGGVDYVFGELDQQTWDITLRSSILFNRDQSLQLYVQPFLTQGDYTDPRWLATPDSYDLRPYDIQVADYDFNYGALNLNLVYRWEYRPGSTIFLVWTHAQERYEERGMSSMPNDWDNDVDFGFPLGVEPGNTFLAKISYWFSI